MKKRTRRKYTNEFKEDAVKLVTDQGYSLAEAARNLGINANMLSQWKRELKGYGKIDTTPGNTASLQAELQRLRKENKRLKMERAILNKATHTLMVHDPGWIWTCNGPLHYCRHLP